MEQHTTLPASLWFRSYSLEINQLTDLLWTFFNWFTNGAALILRESRVLLKKLQLPAGSKGNGMEVGGVEESRREECG